MHFIAWCRFLGDGGYRISPIQIFRIVYVTFTSIYNSIASLAADLKHGKNLRLVEIPNDPVFIIGHWRCGTTLLHELLAMDEKLCAPNTYECFNPGHFLITEHVLKKFKSFHKIATRPQDSVQVGNNKPAEEEFALMMLGIPSFYAYVGFPEKHKSYRKRLFCREMSTLEQQAWQKAMRRFLASLYFKHSKTLVLKNPCNTGKIPLILELFPGARFIYISRNPYEAIPSQIKASHALIDRFSLQETWGFQLNEINDICNLNAMLHSAYMQDKCLIPSGQLHELRYEDLLRAPIRTIQSIYCQLNLGDFEEFNKVLQTIMPSKLDYHPNSHVLSPEQKELIASKCTDYFNNQGYHLSTGVPI